MQLTGIHHLTAISAAIRENHHFYTQTLGLRLVKRSVNQDDVSAYHLFYGDALGTPGTGLTFFDWPVPHESRGTGSILLTCLRVNGEAALNWWVERFDVMGVAHGPRPKENFPLLTAPVLRAAGRFRCSGVGARYQNVARRLSEDPLRDAAEKGLQDEAATMWSQRQQIEAPAFG